MLSRLNLPIQTLIIAILVPTLLFMTVIMGGLIYSHLYETILDGFDKKLIAISSTVAAFTNGDQHEQLVQKSQQLDFDAQVVENSPEFLALIRPFRAIKQQTNLTYLYTLILGNEEGIIYILDANTDDYHTLIGYEDELPQRIEKEIMSVLNEGQIAISGIQTWENWGLIKSGFAPVRDHSGKIVAVAGADIDINIIEKRTRSALFNVGLVGVLSLLVSSVVAFYVAQRLARPINKIKYAALQIAAGKAGAQIEIRSISELERLSKNFNVMSSSLARTIHDLHEQNHAIEQTRRQQELIRILDDLSKQQHTVPAWLTIRFITEHAFQRTASGWLKQSGWIVIWLTNAQMAPLHALKYRLDTYYALNHFVQRFHDQPQKLHDDLYTYLDEKIHALLLIATTQTHNPVSVITKQEVAALRFKNHQIIHDAVHDQQFYAPDNNEMIVFVSEQPPENSFVELLNHDQTLSQTGSSPQMVQNTLDQIFTRCEGIENRERLLVMIVNHESTLLDDKRVL
jgi:methyl-accepting chemotaxis protein